MFPLCGLAQVETVPVQTLHIAVCRQGVHDAFEKGNRASVQFWMDSLNRLDNYDFLAMQWDERWLLYFWLENYPAVFEEAARFTIARENLNAQKIPPPEDSLFQALDNRLYRDREQLFERIGQASLSGEEKIFADLLLDYLLRLSAGAKEADAYDARLDDFMAQYPKSRFSRFIRKRMYNTPPPTDWAFGVDALFLRGNWSGMLERHFRTCYGGDFALAYWQKRWNFYLRLPIGGQKLLRPVPASTFVWEKDKPSTFFGVEMELGYDVYDKTRLRIFPTLGGGYTTIHPPEGGEDNPNPDYYDYFKFSGAHLTAAVQADVKFKSNPENVAGSYHGIRVRLGYRWLNLAGGNPAMRGNMFFFAVGYTIFGRQAQP